MIGFLTFIITAISSYYGVAWFERWSRKLELLDIPNDRSSHEVPTPRGGGLVIVGICAGAYVASTLALSGRVAWSYLFGGLMIAAISWLDDVRSVSFVSRFIVHALGAACVILELGYWDAVHFPFVEGNIELGFLGVVVTFLWIVWVVNAYNFMDGIDGIAGAQALATSGGWIAISVLFDNYAIALYSTAVFGASLGFLIHNWHPANVFMGDVGSAFLGFTFAVLPFLALPGQIDSAGSIPFISILLLWPFLFDTVITFIRRLLKRERVWNAHRDHLYQRMTKNGYKHSYVSTLYGLSAAIIVTAAVLAMNFRDAFTAAALVVTSMVTILLLILARSKKRLT